MVVVAGHKRQTSKTGPKAAENGAAEVENPNVAEEEVEPHCQKRQTPDLAARRWKKMKNNIVATTQVAAEPEAAVSQQAAQWKTQPQTAWKKRPHVSGHL